jgi:hypothetical protein
MKQTQIGIATCSMIFGLALAIVPNRDRSFRGEIMDSFCADMGSHETIRNNIKSARDCTISCVKLGARYELYSPTINKTYRLDDQRTPALFAGEKVRVTGTYDDETNTIHVYTIQPTRISALKQFTSGIKAHFVR